MKNFLIVLVLAAVCVACLGFYMGWFHFTSDSSDGQSHIGVTVDKDKFSADEKKALDKGKQLGH